MRDTEEPRLYADLMLHVAQYLNREHGFPDPLEEQDGFEGVFITRWKDEPNKAINLAGPWEYDRDSETVPATRFLVAHRAENQPVLWELQRRVFRALEREQPFPLTATVQMRYCKRVLSDPPVPDQNGRYVVVDTYECRPYRGTNN